MTSEQPPEESSLSDEIIAYNRLCELGLRCIECELVYKWPYYHASMLNAVKIVKEHGPRLPEDINADLQMLRETCY